MSLVHPGPRAAVRTVVAATRLRRIAGTLPAGAVLMDAVAALFAAAGCRGGMLELAGATFAPFRYVLPAQATDGIHAAWYSHPHGSATAQVECATATVGIRDAAPFLHAHGVWTADGALAMGHVLPFDCVLAADAPVAGLGSDAGWVAGEDAETLFTLFEPEGAGTGPDLLARLRPDEDVTIAVETLCAAAGIREARVSGIGSIAAPRFADGRGVDCLATEVRIAAGHVADRAATLDVELVDIAGTIHAGRLARGLNPVGVTFELAVERLA